MHRISITTVLVAVLVLVTALLTINNAKLVQRLRAAWANSMGENIFSDRPNEGMDAEDYPFFTTDPYIPSVYFAIGGTPEKAFAIAEAGGTPIPSHHSPLFKISPEPAITSGVKATVVALMELMGK